MEFIFDVRCRWWTYMIQVVASLKLALASGLQIWMLPSGCHRKTIQF